MCKTPFDTEDLGPYENKNSATGKKRRRGDLDDEMPSKKKGLDTRGFRPKPKFATAVAWLKKHDTREGDLLLSSKVKALRKELTACRNGDPSDKKVIFIQWMQAAISIGSMLEEEGIGFVYYIASLQLSKDGPLPSPVTNFYQGEMSKEQRGLATEKIRSYPDVKILISGLMCGGTGLNWAWANQVIIVDPWWNKSV